MEISKSLRIISLHDPLFTEKEISISVLRLDEIHPYISGNKWFKLKYNLEEFFRQEKKYLVTFGGAYSNHIMAVAAAGKDLGIKTIGIIRGDELDETSNPALSFASQCGMKLFFISRDEYRHARNNFLPVGIYHALPVTTDDLYMLPEGGSNALAVKGCAEIVKLFPGDFDITCCACGTGATIAGISSALMENQQAIGISVLNGEKFLEMNILKLNGNRRNFLLIHDYNFGGYAKSNAGLDSFCENFFLMHQIKIEPVYTGKMFFAIYELARQDFFKKGSKIVAVHTGGVFPELAR